MPWLDLWRDAEDRANHLAGGRPARDAIDETILWQLRGTAGLVGEPIPLADVHLPEISSGEPWRYERKWIAFVGMNPALHVEQRPMYPTLEMFRQHGGKLIPYFGGRFSPRPTATCGLRHGRDSGEVACWANPAPGLPLRQPTWAALDRVAREAHELARGQQSPAALGEVAAIFDAIPWKFDGGGAIAARTLEAAGWKWRELLDAGAKWLRLALFQCDPHVIVALGPDAWYALSQCLPGLPKKPAFATPYRAKLGATETTVLRYRHPMAHGGAFAQGRQGLVTQLAALLQ